MLAHGGCGAGQQGVGREAGEDEGRRAAGCGEGIGTLTRMSSAAPAAGGAAGEDGGPIEGSSRLARPRPVQPRPPRRPRARRQRSGAATSPLDGRPKPAPHSVLCQQLKLYSVVRWDWNLRGTAPRGMQSAAVLRCDAATPPAAPPGGGEPRFPS